MRITAQSTVCTSLSVCVRTLTRCVYPLRGAPARNATGLFQSDKAGRAGGGGELDTSLAQLAIHRVCVWVWVCVCGRVGVRCAQLCHPLSVARVSGPTCDSHKRRALCVRTFCAFCALFCTGWGHTHASLDLLRHAAAAVTAARPDLHRLHVWLRLPAIGRSC
jgi:hypothetical protein